MKWKKQPGLGDRVVMVGDHPDYGEKGTYDGDGPKGPVVALDNGKTCTLGSWSHWAKIGIDQNWRKMEANHA